MKINIECENAPRKGYTNLNSFKVETQDVAVYDWRNLDGLVEDESVEEIVSNNGLAKLPPQEITSTLVNWYEKLDHGGKLILQFTDIYKVCVAGYKGNMDIRKLHEVIFGHHGLNKSVANIDVMRNILRQMGMRIDTISYDDLDVIMEATKP